MSRQVLDNLLANIEERASTVDPFETNSSRSTIVGLGAAAGKLIMHVGIGVIRGATYANRRVVLARIAAAQEHVVTRLDGAQYRDILEYQRLGLYSRDVNVLAWHIMLVELSRGHTEEIIHALFQPHMTHTDVQVYVQQLVVCHLAKWSRYPRQGEIIVLHKTRKGINTQNLRSRFWQLLAKVQGTSPTLIRDILHIEEFVALLQEDRQSRANPGIQAGPESVSSPDSGSDVRIAVEALLQYCVTQYNAEETAYAIHAFVLYLKPTIEDVKVAVKCVVDSLINLSIETVDISPGDASLIALLDLVTLFCLRVEDASAMFLELGLVEILWHPSLSEGLELGEMPNVIWFQRRCISVLFALSCHSGVEPVADKLFSTSEPLFFVYSIIQTDLALIVQDEGWPWFSFRNDRGILPSLWTGSYIGGRLARDMRQTGVKFVNLVMKRCAEMPPTNILSILSWQNLMQCFRSTDQAETATVATSEAQAEIAFRILLYAVYITQNHMDQVIHLDELDAQTWRQAVSFVMRKCLRDLHDRTSSHPRRQTSHESLLEDAHNKERGMTQQLFCLGMQSSYTMCNPIDVFARLALELLTTGLLHHEVCNTWTFRTFVHALESGYFDIPGLSLSHQELRFREQTVVQLQKVIQLEKITVPVTSWSDHLRHHS